MKNLNDILYQANILDMYPKIENYYRQHLNIEIEEKKLAVNSAENPSEVLQTFIHKNLKSGDVLDGGEIIDSLSRHFDTIFQANSLSFEQLITLKKHIEYILSQRLTYDYMDDFPQALVIKRFMDGCYFAVLQQIKSTLYDHLSKSSSHFNSDIYWDELRNILPHCNLADLIDFEECLQRLQNSKSNTTEEFEELDPKLTNIASQLTDDMQKRMSTFLSGLANDALGHATQAQRINAKETVIKEMLPTLKSQVYIKKNLLLFSPHDHSELNQLLEKTIKNSIFELLYLYEQDVKKSVSDMKKNQKIQFIENLKALCTEDNDVNLLYQEIITNGDLLKSQPIGRYLYECICWLLGIKITTEKYSATLFQAVNTKLNTEKIANLDPKHKQK